MIRCPACGREVQSLNPVLVADGLHGTRKAEACDRCAVPINKAHGFRVTPVLPPCARCGLELKLHIPFAGRPPGWPNACMGYRRD